MYRCLESPVRNQTILSRSEILEDDFYDTFHKQKANELYAGIEDVFALDKIKRPGLFK